eukprot:s50_g74.t1
MSNGRPLVRHMGTPALQIRNRTRLVWAALPFLLTQASAYEAGPSSLSVLEASLVKLKKESAELHEHGTALKEVKPLKSSSNPGAVNAGTETNIAQVRSLEARLSTENHHLRQQLQRTSQKTEDEVSLLATTGAHGDRSFAILVRLLLLFAVVNTVLYLLWNMEGPTVEKVKRRAAEPLMRAMGRGTYEVEISELQALIIGPDDEETGKFPVGDRACSFGCMFLATMLHGVGSGLVGVFIAHLIRTVQIAWHSVTSAFTLCGRRGTYGTGLPLVAHLGAWDAAPLLHGRRDTWRHLPSFCVAGVALGVALTAVGWLWWHIWGPGTPRFFCMAGVALGDICLRFVWQA